MARNKFTRGHGRRRETAERREKVKPYRAGRREKIGESRSNEEREKG